VEAIALLSAQFVVLGGVNITFDDVFVDRQGKNNTLVGENHAVGGDFPSFVDAFSVFALFRTPKRA